MRGNRKAKMTEKKNKKKTQEQNNTWKDIKQIAS